MAIIDRDPFFVLEAIGTVAFAISGGTAAVRAGMDWLGVVVLAVVTAVGGGTLRDLLIGAGGGVIRDVLARERPLVLVSEIYALAALAGAVVVVTLTAAEVEPVVLRWGAVGVVLTIRLVAIRRQWMLPGFANGGVQTPGT